MKAIYWKEMRQYFHSIIGYVFLAIFVLINSYYFFPPNLPKKVTASHETFGINEKILTHYRKKTGP